jgi:thermostable 8-oxoguanine DNA glycosylase
MNLKLKASLGLEVSLCLLFASLSLSLFLILLALLGFIEAKKTNIESAVRELTYKLETRHKKIILME